MIQWYFVKDDAVQAAFRAWEWLQKQYRKVKQMVKRQHRHDWKFSKKINADEFIEVCQTCQLRRHITRINAGLKLCDYGDGRVRQIRR